MADRDWDRLAGLARERRVELGLTQEDVRAAGGPSTASIRLIEGALQRAYQPATLRDLERALQWERGSVARILAGGDPLPLGDVPAPRSPVQVPSAAPAPRDRKLPVLGLDPGEEEALQPYLLELTRELYAAAGLQLGPGREVPDLPEVEEYLASLPGALIFAADHEARVWDYEPMSAQERLRLIAVLRQMGAAARDAAEEPGERNAVLARAT